MMTSGLNLDFACSCNSGTPTKDYLLQPWSVSPTPLFNPSRSSVRRQLVFMTSIFARETFYLDLNGHQDAVTIEEDILLLGGKVEKFLSKDIKFVVTNKRKPRGASTASAVASPESTIATPSTRSRRSHSNSVNSPLQALSRGQALLLKSNNSKNNSTSSPIADVLSRAKEWGIKIVQVAEIKRKITREKKRCGTNEDGSPRKSVKPKELKAPFIKYEDVFQTYRVNYHPFITFPTVHVPGEDGENSQFEGSPFDKDTHTAPVSVGKKSSKPTTNYKKKSTQLPGYCECCEERYQDLKEHLASDMHKKFGEDIDNFAILDSTIAKLPSLADFVAQLSLSDREIENTDDVTDTSSHGGNHDNQSSESGNHINSDNDGHSCDVDVLAKALPDNKPETTRTNDAQSTDTWVSDVPQLDTHDTVHCKSETGKQPKKTQLDIRCVTPTSMAGTTRPEDGIKTREEVCSLMPHLSPSVEPATTVLSPVPLLEHHTAPVPAEIAGTPDCVDLLPSVSQITGQAHCVQVPNFGLATESDKQKSSDFNPPSGFQVQSASSKKTDFRDVNSLCSSAVVNRPDRANVAVDKNTLSKKTMDSSQSNKLRDLINRISTKVLCTESCQDNSRSISPPGVVTGSEQAKAKQETRVDSSVVHGDTFDGISHFKNLAVTDVESVTPAMPQPLSAVGHFKSVHSARANDVIGPSSDTDWDLDLASTCENIINRLEEPEPEAIHTNAWSSGAGLPVLKETQCDPQTDPFLGIVPFQPVAPPSGKIPLVFSGPQHLTAGTSEVNTIAPRTTREQRNEVPIKTLLAEMVEQFNQDCSIGRLADWQCFPNIVPHTFQSPFMDSFIPEDCTLNLPALKTKKSKSRKKKWQLKVEILPAKFIAQVIVNTDDPTTTDHHAKTKKPKSPAVEPEIIAVGSSLVSMETAEELPVPKDKGQQTSSKSLKDHNANPKTLNNKSSVYVAMDTPSVAMDTPSVAMETVERLPMVTKDIGSNRKPKPVSKISKTPASKKKSTTKATPKPGTRGIEAYFFKLKSPAVDAQPQQVLTDPKSPSVEITTPSAAPRSNLDGPKQAAKTPSHLESLTDGTTWRVQRSGECKLTFSRSKLNQSSTKTNKTTSRKKLF